MDCMTPQKYLHVHLCFLSLLKDSPSVFNKTFKV